MSAPYTDTIIIDCNRNCSVENDAGNDTTPALFTNKQGTGLKLDAGDKVSIHSAYINEIGNTDGTLEFKGQTLKNSKGEEQTYTLTESVNTKTLEQPLDNTWSRAGDLPWGNTPVDTGARYPTGEEKQKWGKPTGYSEKQILQPYGFKKSSFSNVERTYVMKDNEMNMQISYYKTANGENCFHLPRRFDTHTASRGRKYIQLPEASSGTPGDEDTYTADTNPHISTRLYGGSGNARDHGTNNYRLLSEPGEDLLVWAYKGLQCDAGMGTPSEIARRNGELPFDNAGNGACLNTPRLESMLEGDWKFADMGMYKATKSVTSGAGQYQDPAGIGCESLNSLGTDARYSMVHDNSKYKIYVKEETYFTNSPVFHQFLTDAQEGDQIKPSNLEDGKINDFLSYQPSGSVTAGHTAYPVTDAQLTHAYFNVRDPACTGAWIPYNEIKNVKVPVGYSSPEDIAEKVSQELNKINKEEPIFARTGTRQATTPPNTTPTGNMANIGANHVQVGVKKDGECYKNFYATNHGHFHDRNCQWYFVNSANGTDADLPEKSGSDTRYMSAYHYLGIKRPSLYDTGKALIEPEITGGLGNTWGEFEDWTLNASAPAITWANRATAEIHTSIPWSKRTLLRDMFIAQSEYPELFNYKHSNIADAGDFTAEVDTDTFQMGNKDTGVAYARFIHFDIIKDDANCWFQNAVAGTGLKHHESRRLGSDNYRWCVNTDPLTPVTAVSPDAYESIETQTGFDVGISSDTFSTLPINIMVMDETKDAGYKPMYDMSSCPLWFYYDQSKAEIDSDKMAYGCMTKVTYGGVDYISFSTEEIGGIPNHFFRKGGNPSADVLATAGDRQELDDKNKLGYDRHFNAYGTKTMMLYSGYLNAVQDCKICDTALLPVSTGGLGPIHVTSPNNVPGFIYMAPPGNIRPVDNLEPFTMPAAQTSIPDATENSLEMVYQHFLGTQLGANSLALTYDADKQKRFSFSYLHTPEYIGNNFDAGSDATNPIVDDAGNKVYKINKRLNGDNFCPDMVPYTTDISTASKDASGTAIEVALFNNNLVPFNVVYDSPTGIMFNDFGVSQDKRQHWNKCLWGLLGFSYDQFNFQYEQSSTLDILSRMNSNSRVNPDNQGNTPEIYTNALVKSADITLYHTNSYGAHIYGEMAPSGPIYQFKDRGTDPQNFPGVINSPAITIDAVSVSIKADNQPTKMLRPYYLIKSNIVGDMKYYGAGNSTEGGQLLPIVGVVNKENGFGDYYFQTSVKNVFTITTPTTLSEVTTSIHDPDMSLARVDNNCAVLYMVEKENTNNLNLVNTLVQEKKFNPKTLNPVTMTDADYNAYFKTFILNKSQMKQEEANFNARHEDPIWGRPNPNVPGMPVVAGRVDEASVLDTSFTTPERPWGEVLPAVTSEGPMTRAQAESLRQFEAVRERARGLLGQRFAVEGTPDEQQLQEQEEFDLAEYTELGDPTDHTSQLQSSVFTGSVSDPVPSSPREDPADEPKL